jgi:hypothetical protein
MLLLVSSLAIVYLLSGCKVPENVFFASFLFVAAAVTAAAVVAKAGLMCADEGVSAVTLHARTADQQYSPPAQWAAIKQLVDLLPPHLPVIGNGDIFEAADALQMMRETGCQGKSGCEAALDGLAGCSSSFLTSNCK